MKRITSVFFLCLVFVISKPLLAEEERLFFTYGGPVIGSGMNRMVYRDWDYDSNTRGSKILTGFFLSGGGILNIYVDNFIGEFSLEYAGDFSGEERVSVSHMLYTTAGKYSYTLKQFNNNLAVASGLGVYLESAPSSRDYKGGGGVNFLIGAVYSLNREIKLLGDIVVRYGYFGIGDDSNKLSVGAKVGAVYKVGRI